MQFRLVNQGCELTGVHPVLVHEQNRLCTALLTAASVRILIAHPRDIVDVAHIWPQYLPVKTSVLQEYLQHKLLSRLHSASACDGNNDSYSVQQPL